MLSGDEISEKAYNVLRRNIVEFDDVFYISPKQGHYPEQFFWDSGFHSIVMRHFNLEYAIKEILTFLKGQWPDGFLPHIIYWNFLAGYPGRTSLLTRIQNKEVLRLYKPPYEPPTSRLIGPPIMAIAAWLIVKSHVNKAFSRAVVSSFIRFFRWIRKYRFDEATKLVSIIHPWETGLDDSPIFDDIFHFSKWKLSSTLMYNFHYLPKLLRKYSSFNWNQRKALELFNFKSVHYNSILIAAIRSIMQICSTISDYKDCRDNSAYLNEMLWELVKGLESLWDGRKCAYIDRFGRENKQVRSLTFSIFLPLLTGAVSRDRVECLIQEHLLNKDEFWFSSKVKYVILTVSTSDPMFSPGGFSYKLRGKHWRGPVWMNTNWLITRGLLNYGYTDVAKSILKNSLELISKTGFYEKYDPRNGKGLGERNQSWSTSMVDILRDMSPLFDILE